MPHPALFWLIVVACLAVLGILMVGVIGFARGGEFNRKYANKIMRLRLLAQFVAVVIIVAAVYFGSGLF
ncbi:MAG: twin transmembrane helix small protein [Paracoccaceae bacterium]